MVIHHIPKFVKGTNKHYFPSYYNFCKNGLFWDFKNVINFWMRSDSNFGLYRIYAPLLESRNLLLGRDFFMISLFVLLLMKGAWFSSIHPFLLVHASEAWFQQILDVLKWNVIRSWKEKLRSSMKAFHNVHPLSRPFFWWGRGWLFSEGGCRFYIKK